MNKFIVNSKKKKKILCTPSRTILKQSENLDLLHDFGHLSPDNFVIQDERYSWAILPKVTGKFKPPKSHHSHAGA